MSRGGSVADFSDRAVKVFRECSQVPVASRGRIFPSPSGKYHSLEVAWIQKELERGKKVAYGKSYFVDAGTEGESVQILCEATFQSECTNV